MFTLEVVIRTPHSLKVVEVVAGLAFTGGNHTRQGGIDEYVFEGDEATLTDAQRRLISVPEAICVLQEVVEDQRRTHRA